METPTKVIFRVWLGADRKLEDSLGRRHKVRDVIALFPEIAADPSPRHCQSYEHLGQHGAADARGVMELTRPATPKEYADLKRELRQRGYRLRVIHRNRRSFMEERRKQLIT